MHGPTRIFWANLTAFSLLPAAHELRRLDERDGAKDFLCLITPLCSYLYGGLYGGLYERAHIIRYFPRRRATAARPSTPSPSSSAASPTTGSAAAGPTRCAPPCFCFVLLIFVCPLCLFLSVSAPAPFSLLRLWVCGGDRRKWARLCAAESARRPVLRRDRERRRRLRRRRDRGGVTHRLLYTAYL